MSRVPGTILPLRQMRSQGEGSVAGNTRYSVPYERNPLMSGGGKCLPHHYMPTGDPPKGSGSINWPMYPKEYETHNSLRTPARVAEVKAAGYKVPSRAPEGLGQNNDRMQVGRRLALLSLGPRPVLMQALALDTCQDDLIGHRALSAARALTVCRRTRTGAVSPVRSTRRRYKCTVPKRTWSQDTTTHLLSSTRAQTRLTPSKPRQRTIGPTSMRLRTTTLNSRSDTRRGVVSTESGRSLVQRALAHMRMGMARAPVSPLLQSLSASRDGRAGETRQ